MIELYRNLNQKQVDICCLVLKSSGIFHRTEKSKSGWRVWVLNADVARAKTVMADYARENSQTEFLETRETGKRPAVFAGIFTALVLMSFYLAAGENRNAIHRAFGSSAEHILSGEFYRTVTSLFLHVDAVHLLGNMAAIAVFGSVVCSIHGIGLGWLMILLTGIAGNFINAVVHQTRHLSIGASTAVFGAIGILSAYQFWQKMNLPGERVKAWLPLGGGMALLAFLGSGGGRVDIMAHLFGFFTGLALETPYAIWRHKDFTHILQAAFLSAAAAIVVLSWVLPLWMSR